MTRKEAIEILKEIEFPMNGDNCEYREQALQMAISALETKESYQLEHENHE